MKAFLETIDARAWIGVACFVLVLIVLGMIQFDRTLLHDDFFKVLATAIVLTAWINGPVGWAYQATKTGGDLGQQNADIVKANAAASPPISDPDASDKLDPEAGK